MTWFCNAIYVALLLAYSPWLLFQACRTGKYRSGWKVKLTGAIPVRQSAAPCIWFHAVSVGELRVLERVIAGVEAEYPGHEIAVSTTTKTAQELAAQLFPEAIRFVCPFDFSWAVRETIKRLRPQTLVLAELEVWPNLIAAARSARVPVAIVNARLSERSYRGYRRVSRLLSPTFESFAFVGAQTKEYADRFALLGVSHDALQVTGSIKFDGVQLDRLNPQSKELAELSGVRPEDHVLLAGSTQPEEVSMAVRVMERLAEKAPQLRLIVVPRHPEHFAAAAKVIASSGLAWQRRSGLANSDGHFRSAAGERQASRSHAWRILLVDSIGELSAWWGIADLAFVGGSFGRRGGQNMIEPAAYGAAVCFGPKTGNFRDVVEQLLNADAAIRIDSEEGLEEFAISALTRSAWADGMGQRAQEVVRRQQGATERTMNGLARFLKVDEAHLRPLVSSEGQSASKGKAA